MQVNRLGTCRHAKTIDILDWPVGGPVDGIAVYCQPRAQFLEPLLKLRLDLAVGLRSDI
jgi:hypothetical protein